MNQGRESNLPASGQQKGQTMRKFTCSLLSLSIGSLFAVNPTLAAERAASQETIVVSAEESDNSADEAGGTYTTPVTRAGTKMNLTARDIPQSVSVTTAQRLKDQNLQNVGEALSSVTGITASQNDTERTDFYSRGFYIDNYLYDDIPSAQTASWNFGETDGDAAIYDRIDIVRGATGLMTGSGNPGASINMIRKKADSKIFDGNLSASYGSWDNQRYVADLGGPLNDSGSLRGRVVTGYQDKDSWLDRYHKRKKFLYATMAADLTSNTTLDIGYDYQNRETKDPTWGGLPIWYSNGNKIKYDRSDNPAADWTYYNILSRKVFANLTTHFDNGWETRINSTYAKSMFDSKLLYLSGGFPDETTGIFPYGGYAGWYRGLRTQTAVDAYATGPFSLFGRQHLLIAGVDYSRQRNRYIYSSPENLEVGDWNSWNGDIADPQWSDWALSSEDVIRQDSGYLASRLSLTDPLSLIVGARYTKYSAQGTLASMEKNNITPYGGLIYDINENYSAFASYTSIFKPQTYRHQDGTYLKPLTGRDYETGIKGDWNSGAVTGTLSLFRIEQDNLGQIIPDAYVNNSSENAYKEVQGVVSKGVDFEVNGQVTDNLKMTLGATRYVAKDSAGDRTNPYMPQTSVKLFTSYTLPALPKMTIGGGANWQNRVYKDVTNPAGKTERIHQGSFMIANVFTRYQVNKNLSVQGNINNLFDKEYNTDTADGIAYNEPRNATITVNYNF